MENLIIAKNKTSNIPQNESAFFLIRKYDKWNYAIQIKFNFIEKIKYLNLYFIIKSFALSTQFPPYAICTVFKTENTEVITQRENIRWFKNIDYYNFCDWINFRIQNDVKYNTNEKFHCIIIVYSKSLCFLCANEFGDAFLDLLKPNYPWNVKWLNNFKNEIEEIELLKAQLNYYKSITIL